MNEYTIKDWKFILSCIEKNKGYIIKLKYPDVFENLDIIRKFLYLLTDYCLDNDMRNNMNGLLVLLEKLKKEDCLYLLTDDYIDFVLDEASLGKYISGNSLVLNTDKCFDLIC